MILKVCVNREYEFRLFTLQGVQYQDEISLKLLTGNFTEVKNAFSNIDIIEIYKDDNKIIEYTLYDSYASIVYSGEVYLKNENISYDCIEVILKRTSLAEQVRRIEETISNNIDIESMNVDEYRQYILEQISNDCRQDIYNGTSIEINGVEQNFSFKAEDQINLLQLYLMTKMYSTITAVPYHSDGHTCMFYTSEQIQKIYMTLITRLITITTYVNQLNLYAETLSTKDALSQLEYGMELPEQYASVVSMIVNETVSALGGIVSEEGNSNEVDD